MIKVSVIYPRGEDTEFNIDYYCDSHMPMVQKLLGSACTGIAAEEGIAGGAPDAPAPYHAMGHLYFDSVEDFQTSFGPQSRRDHGRRAQLHQCRTDPGGQQGAYQ